MMKYKHISIVVSCPFEDVWRLLQFPIHLHDPLIERLQMHLPLQHPIVFSNNTSLPSLLRRPNIDRTMLI